MIQQAIRENDELRVRAMEMALIFWNDQPLTPEELVRAADKIYQYLTQGKIDQ